MTATPRPDCGGGRGGGGGGRFKKRGVGIYMLVAGFFYEIRFFMFFFLACQNGNASGLKFWPVYFTQLA